MTRSHARDLGENPMHVSPWSGRFLGCVHQRNVASCVGRRRRTANLLVISMVVRGRGIRQSPLPWSARQRYKHQLWQRRFFKMRACSTGNFPSSQPCRVACLAPQKLANHLIFHKMWCGIIAPVSHICVARTKKSTKNCASAAIARAAVAGAARAIMSP